METPTSNDALTGDADADAVRLAPAPPPRLQTGQQLCLIAFDAVGFSGYVESLAAEHGRHAGEHAAATLFRAEHAIAADVSERGFHMLDALGDGAVYATDRALTNGALSAIVRGMTKRFAKETGREARAAWVRGEVFQTPLRTQMLEHSTFVWGEGLARLHEAMQAAPRPRTRIRNTRPTSPMVTQTANDGDVERMAFVFFRLLGRDRWRSVDVATVDQALSQLARWATSFGGRLERMTQDEKGFHVRLGAPVWTLARGWTLDLATPNATLQALGFDGAAALAVGPVYSGQSASGTRAVCGEAVNRAAKLCATAASGKIVLDESARVWMQRAETVSPRAPSGRAEIAREACAWLANAPAGDARALLFEGPPGIGKTFLLDDVLAQFNADAGLDTSIAIQAAASLGLRPYGLAIELLRNLLSLQAATADQEQALVKAALDNAGLDADSAHFLSPATRTRLPESPRIAALAPGERAVATEAAFVTVLAALSRIRPQLVALDDIHNADDETIAILDRLFEHNAPLRVVATARPVETAHKRLLAYPAWCVLNVAPFSVEAFETLVLSHDPKASRDWIDGLYSASGGSPFFAIQAAAALAEKRKLGAVDTSADQAPEIGPLDLALDSRLDNLSAEERAIMRALAVFDRPIPLDLLHAVLRATTAEFDERALARLADGHFLRWAASDQRSVAPSHALVADAVTRRTPQGVRRMLAARAARTLHSSAAPTARDAFLSEAARLWGEAGQPGRAAIAYERAACQAARQGSHATAAQLATLALAQFPATQQRRAVRWYSERAVAEWSLGRIGAANATARRCLQVARAFVLPKRLRPPALAAAAVRAETGQFIGNLVDILGAASDARRFASETREAYAARGRALASVGYFLDLLRLHGPARHYYDAGEKLGAADGATEAGAYTTTARAIMHLSRAEWDEGARFLDRAQSYLSPDGGHQLREIIGTTRGMAAHLRGETDRALECFAVVRILADERRNAMHGAWARYASAQTMLAADNAEDAWPALIDAQALLRGVEDNHSHHICTALEARLRLERGDLDGALDAAHRANAFSKTLPTTNYSSLEACSAAALVSASILLRPEASRLHPHARTLLRGALGPLRRFAMMFPIGRPRLAGIEALRCGARDDRETLRRLSSASQQAQSMHMKGEATLFERFKSTLTHRVQ